MPRLRDLTSGKVTGSGTLSLATDSRTLGGIGISADGTNLATLTIREDNASGNIIFQMSTTSSIFIGAPFEATDTIYYTISGTGASVELFEWIPYRGSRD